MHNLSRVFLFLIFGVISMDLIANNLQISGFKFIKSDQVQINLFWENAWNTPNQVPNNHDAVWVFLKYSELENNGFKTLNLVPGTWFSNDGIFTIQVGKNGLGAMVSPAKIWEGKISGMVVLTLTNKLPSGLFNFKAFGTEMVYIPSGPFWLGDSSSNLCLAENKSNSKNPIYISSEAAIYLKDIAGNGGALGQSLKYILPEAYPKGTRAFYCMKYELAQIQYVDYLNCLTKPEQLKRIHISEKEIKIGKLALVPNAGNPARNSVVCASNSDINPLNFGCDANGNGILNEETDGQARACNWLSWADVSAYLAWAGLRPLTELEFEKVCRGQLPPIPKEFAWGGNNAVKANSVTNDGSFAESVSENGTVQLGLANYALPYGQKYIIGPLRTGFAANDTTTRTEAAAGYYGVMELSGNVWEPCVSVNAIGSQFSGSQDSINSGWPDSSASGIILRGGAWLSLIFNNPNYGFRDLATSDRFYRDTPISEARYTTGGRGAWTEE